MNKRWWANCILSCFLGGGLVAIVGAWLYSFWLNWRITGIITLAIFSFGGLLVWALVHQNDGDDPMFSSPHTEADRKRLKREGRHE